MSSFFGACILLQHCKNLILESNMDNYWTLCSVVSKKIFLPSQFDQEQGCVMTDKVGVYME